MAANDMLRGHCCSLCGVYFTDDHGHPVICGSCANDLVNNDGASRKSAGSVTLIEYDDTKYILTRHKTIGVDHASD